MKNRKPLNVVVIGGGTGAYTVLSALKLLDNINITAVVASTDSGGSTGILRDEFGNLPVGDFRQCLVALSSDDNSNKGNIIRDLFTYRFEKGGDGLKGHNFGNLFLTALTEILGSDEEAFKKASKILNVKGRVFPVTFDKIQLLAKYEDDSIAYGEKMIDDPPKSHNCELKITKLWVQPKSMVYKKTKEAISNADLIILGPGDLYTSTIANLVIDDMPGIIKKSGAKIAYIVNLVTKYGESHNFNASDFVNEVQKYLKSQIDYVLINNAPIPKKILDMYSLENAYSVEDDMAKVSKNINIKGKIIRADVISNEIYSQKKSDKVKRSLLRHDVYKLSLTIQKEIISKL